MPYIDQDSRDKFDSKIDALAEALRIENLRIGENTPGNLNYVITELLVAWLRGHAYYSRAFPAATNYSSFNEVIGVLECAKLELYRRQIAPYENKKCEENGDVYKRIPYPSTINDEE